MGVVVGDFMVRQVQREDRLREDAIEKHPDPEIGVFVLISG
ncbi:hypothetical protein [Celeribacter ethanolicus]|nr:hypothetical protein [Celeribacter ethanolicus]